MAPVLPPDPDIMPLDPEPLTAAMSTAGVDVSEQYQPEGRQHLTYSLDLSLVIFVSMLIGAIAVWAVAQVERKLRPTMEYLMAERVKKHGGSSTLCWVVYCSIIFGLGIALLAWALILIELVTVAICYG